LGALIGFSAEPFVEEEQVVTLEAFADQSALSIEAAALIDRLRRLNERLAEANRVKSEFLATMSHELRTPLTAIIGFSELLMEGVMGELTEEQKESLTEVLHNAADLLELINSLLDLTKIESGKMRLDVRNFDLAETLRRVVSTISPLVQRKNQRLVAEIPDGMPPLSGDERKVQQLILNLLANANKFTPEGGSITASVRVFPTWGDICERAPWAEKVRDRQDELVGGAFEIVVKDDGIGIAPDHLDRIFEMFTQVDGSATRSFGGTGVGLALARKFVEMHSGLIWVESEWGKGARFVVVMPASEGAQGGAD
ncbi:MAG TPA: HAMP domain-containing sensor histidine kinase, partial [bacterium]|nr:HAMP domain-containing sensor histidine kinase [bacterium]